ncbi:hypothetical protein, partial [Sutterella wadsworthensis]|uniref:hypothetical protein n=1 Tax=Sutterella wadsworthensis TaxID=40545 RepID=UPI0019D19FAD
KIPPPGASTFLKVCALAVTPNGFFSLPPPPPATGFSPNSPLFLFEFQSVIDNSPRFTASPNVSLIQLNI